MSEDLASPHAAPQQRPGPRPLPLFLELVRRTALRDPELARAALAGLRRYQEAEAPPRAVARPIVAEHGGASLRDCGGRGRTLLLVPSPINPPTILDLDPERSLAAALGTAARVLMLDWGPANARAHLDLAGHVKAILLPLVEQSGSLVLAGYCLGGTLSLAAATRSAEVEGVLTLASPWNFEAYPQQSRRELMALWQASAATSARLGVLPTEVLQAAFWSLDPERTVAKFARLAAMPRRSPEADSFVALEDWTNGGEPLPLPAARELVEDLFGQNVTGCGHWLGQGLPSCPQLHIRAMADRIVPPASAADGPRLDCQSGHVGMIVGRRAPRELHAPVLSWLEALGPAR